MSLLDDVIGALLIATWTNSALVAFEVVLAYKYFTNYPNDPALTKAAVCGAMLMDALTTTFEYITVYMYSVIHWGSQEFLAVQPWTLPAYALTTEWGAFIVQIYLIYRFWRLSCNTIVTVFLSILSLGGVGANIWVSYGLVQYVSYDQRGLLKNAAIVWYSSVVGTDVCIALSLAFVLQRMRKVAFKTTDRTIVRLMYAAISTGSLTAFAALLNMLLYLLLPTTNWGPFVCFNIGRIYTLTMLFNLTHRKHNRVAAASRSAPGVDSSASGYDLQSVGGRGIQIHRVVHVDTAQDQKTDEPDGQIPRDTKGHLAV